MSIGWLERQTGNFWWKRFKEWLSRVYFISGINGLFGVKAWEKNWKIQNYWIFWARIILLLLNWLVYLWQEEYLLELDWLLLLVSFVFRRHSYILCGCNCTCEGYANDINLFWTCLNAKSLVVLVKGCAYKTYLYQCQYQKLSNILRPDYNILGKFIRIFEAGGIFGGIILIRFVRSFIFPRNSSFSLSLLLTIMSETYNYKLRF